MLPTIQQLIKLFMDILYSYRQYKCVRKPGQYYNAVHNYITIPLAPAYHAQDDIKKYMAMPKQPTLVTSTATEIICNKSYTD